MVEQMQYDRLHCIQLHFVDVDLNSHELKERNVLRSDEQPPPTGVLIQV
jgi:hypothetical protein